MLRFLEGDKSQEAVSLESVLHGLGRYLSLLFNTFFGN